MKRMTFISFFIVISMGSALLWADSGVVVDTKGIVTINVPKVGITAAKVGMEMPEGSVIKTGSDGYTTILFVSGQIRKMTPNSEVVLAKDKTVEGNTTIIRGISLALNDMKTKGEAPAVHGMVKGGAEEYSFTPEYQQRMNADLKKVDELGLESSIGKNILKAQVYYKYRQYQSVLDTLLPIYQSTNPPPPVVKSQIALTYKKMGKLQEAKLYE